MNEQCCGTCKFLWFVEESDSETGFCRRFPPYPGFTWREMPFTQWCGEWRNKEEDKEETSREIENWRIAVRTRFALRKEGINTLEDIKSNPEIIFRTRNLGQASQTELVSYIIKHFVK